MKTDLMNSHQKFECWLSFGYQSSGYHLDIKCYLFDKSLTIHGIQPPIPVVIRKAWGSRGRGFESRRSDNEKTARNPTGKRIERMTLKMVPSPE